MAQLSTCLANLDTNSTVLIATSKQSLAGGSYCVNHNPGACNPLGLFLFGCRTRYS